MFVPRKIFVEKGLEESALARRVLDCAPEASVEYFGELRRLLAGFEALPMDEAKKNLVVATRAGGFVKDFPSGPGIDASGWRYFIPAIGCPADCRYCFLQTYHPAGAPVVFVGQEAMLAELDADVARSDDGYFYGGELCDNLMLDGLLDVTGRIVSLFRRRPRATCELRTKSAEIEALLAVEPPPNVIISWTFSPDEVVRACEQGTASLDERIEAARAVERHGYRVGLRMDPIVLEGDWRAAYADLVRRLAARLDPALIDSAHLGCMRYTPGLKAIAAERFGRGTPFAGEFVMCQDGKLRYPRPVRAAAYAEIAGMLSEWDPGISIRLVMEPPDVIKGFHEVCAFRSRR